MFSSCTGGRESLDHYIHRPLRSVQFSSCTLNIMIEGKKKNPNKVQVKYTRTNKAQAKYPRASCVAVTGVQVLQFSSVLQEWECQQVLSPNTLRASVLWAPWVPWVVALRSASSAGASLLPTPACWGVRSRSIPVRSVACSLYRAWVAM